HCAILSFGWASSGLCTAVRLSSGYKSPFKGALIMKKLMTVTAVGCLGLGMMAWAHDDDKMKMPPQSASSPEFQQLKQLVGNWKGMHQEPGAKQPTPTQVTFKLTAAGSAVEETLMQGTPHEMVDMYHDENGKLAMTHYCAIGN